MEKRKWKWFLVKRFLQILILVSLSEWLLGIVYDSLVFPWLSDTLNIQFFSVGLESGQTIGVLLRGGLYLAVMGICNLLPDVMSVGLRAFGEWWAGSAMTEKISHQTAYLSPRQTQIYIWGTVALTILILLTLLFPYVAAALTFSRMAETQLKRMEEQERRQKEEYDRRRNLLLSDVAHDLKTPMTTVAGYAKALLEEDSPPEKRQEYLETIYNKSMQMSRLLNFLFEYVELDSEGFELKKTTEDLWELLRECIAGLYMDFEEKEMELLLKIPEDLCQMEVDRVQFQRVINNLLNNALRHNSPHTCVWVMAEQEDERITIQVCDNGAVIPEQTAKYIFEPFVLGDQSRKSKGGSGLGLSIAWKVIAMHGGTLTLVQEEGEAYTKAFVIRFFCPPTDHIDEFYDNEK